MKHSEITCIVLDSSHFNSLGLVRSLGEAGINPFVVLIEKEGKSLISKSKYPREIYHVDNAQEGIDFIIKNFAHESENNKIFILTGSDTVIHVIDANFNKLHDKFITFNCGEQGVLQSLMSKIRQNELAESAGLNVPKYELVKRGDFPQKISFPLITKASISIIDNWKAVTHLCYNEEDLKEAYHDIHCEYVMLQEYIDKENETGFNGIAINDGKEVYMPLQLSYRETYETTFGNEIILNRPNNEALLNKIKTLISKTGYNGVFSVDLLVSKEKENGENKIYFLEINFRNSGWSYPYTCAGINLPYIWCRSVLNKKLETLDIKIKPLPFTSVVDFEDLMKNFRSGILNGIKYLSRTIKSDSHIYWNKYDLGPFWLKFTGFIRNRVKGL